jgi:hypothetical protein
MPSNESGTSTYTVIDSDVTCAAVPGAAAIASPAQLPAAAPAGSPSRRRLGRSRWLT